MTVPAFAVTLTTIPEVLLYIALPAIAPILISRLAVRYFTRKTRPKDLPLVPVPQPARDQPPAIYNDDLRYGEALSEWDLECGLHEATERARMRARNRAVPETGPFAAIATALFLVAMIVAMVNAPTLMVANLFAIAGFLAGLGITGGITALETKHWLAKSRKIQLPRPFTLPLPVYQPLSRSRQQEYFRPGPPPQADIRITSLPQAFQILGLQARRVTLQEARAAHRALMAQYHPDKVHNLGPELRELAARKALEMNLAIQFIEANAKGR